MDDVKPHLDLVELLGKEEKDHIENIRFGAAQGNPASKALLASIETKEAKLKQIRALYKFLVRLSNAPSA